MNDSKSWGQGSRFYDQLYIMVEMNDYGSWAKGSKCYEQRKVVVDMNESRVLSLGLYMLLTTQGCGWHELL